MKPLILALLVMLISGILYFNAWIKLSLLFLATFFSLNVLILHGLLVPGHSVVFWVIIFTFVIWPASLMILFALDMRYGWFCFDMSYSWVWVWGSVVILFVINVVGSALRFLLAGA